ncbi:MAG: DNA mismatch repair endonuclease MutL [Chitinophagales bacterium]|nr:DNA mismatch repair endonuclease MutL [Chitinophagales bacterium]MDW8393970.1 DNA mismatch repair endonuclease MutL [Chitinophagales bacterium]
MDVIRQLPDHVANQIAAGEVILRPASAVKELMENSLDAGADRIQVTLREAGKQLIEVSDNGCGMSESDARMCFERHATSKITRIEDLHRLLSMGFRGEALASIAAVAQVELRTRRPHDELGTLLVLEGSKVLRQEPAVLPAGTTISVKNLFFNVPARRAFLKSNQAELRHIIDVFTRLALARPDVQMELMQYDVTIISVPKASLRQRIVHLLGNPYNEKIIPIEEQTNVVNISGYIGKPDSARRTRGDQFLFVNRRFIRSPYLHRAVVSAYGDLLRPDTYPLYVLFLEVDPARIDVNIHPTKEEVRFEDEKILYAFVHAAARHALARFTQMPTLDFSQETAIDRLPAFQQMPAAAPPPADPSADGRPLQVTLNTSRPRHWEKLLEVARSERPVAVVVPSEATADTQPPAALEDFSLAEVVPYQLHGRYVLSPVKSGFVLIDQQAAHERILFERLLHSAVGKRQGSQQQLFPETLHLSASHAALLEELLTELRELGFELEPFGTHTYLIRGMPAEIGVSSGRETLEQLLQDYQEEGQHLKLRLREQLAASLARRLAIRAGKTLTVKEMQELIDRLFACTTPYWSPFGKRTLILFDEEEIVRLFGERRS